MLREVARLQAGETVAVIGAGGGVGAYAIQIARALGAGTVVAASGTPARRALAETLGADQVVDYTTASWVDEVRTVSGGGVDVALEGVGSSLTNDTLAALGPFGRMVVFGYASGRFGALTPDEQAALFYQPVLNQSVTGFNIGLWFALRPDAAVAALGELIGLVAGGSVTVPIGGVLPLADAARAHELLESRDVAGKVILKPW
jgi:NADPH2:quinone reductase